MTTTHDRDLTQSLPTLAHVLERIAADRRLPARHRGKLAQSVRKLAQFTGLDPSRTKASFNACRGAMCRFEPAQAGISRTYWQHIKSGARAAFARYGLPQRRHLRTDLPPVWRRLRERLTRRSEIHRLSRFIHFCGYRGIKPSAVSEHTSAAFLAHLREETSVAAPERIHRRMCRQWNLAARSVPGWPQTRLTVPTYRKDLVMPLSRFPKSFAADLADWQRSALSAEPGLPDGHSRALSLATVTHMHRQIRRFAAALVHQGVPAGEITDLAALVRPDRFTRGIRFFWERAERRPTPGQYNLAVNLKGLARDWARLDPGALAELDRTTSRLACPRKRLTARNLAIIRQFDAPGNVAKLLALPGRLAAAAERREPQRAAVLMQRAVAIELLLVAPIRPRNLIPLRLDRHFDFAPERGGNAHLVIPGDEVKNGMPVDIELPDETAQLVKAYVRRYRPILATDDADLLFPGRKGDHLHPVWFARAIVATVHRWTGLKVTVQGFRHIAAKLFLDRNPHQYILVSLLLGHRSVETTMAYYCVLEGRAVARRHASQVLGRGFGAKRPD